MSVMRPAGASRRASTHRRFRPRSAGESSRQPPRFKLLDLRERRGLERELLLPLDRIERRRRRRERAMALDGFERVPQLALRAALGGIALGRAAHDAAAFAFLACTSPMMDSFAWSGPTTGSGL